MDRKTIITAAAVTGTVLAAQAIALWVYNRYQDAAAARKLRVKAEETRLAQEAADAAVRAASTSGGSGQKRPVRIYMDGCFDMAHYGHANALRQARAVGDILVVGLVNDAEIVKNKGSPPVMNEAERYAALSACKFVDEVIRDAPYDLTEDWVKTLVTKHQIDYIVHGDDPCITADGKDAYAYAKSIGRYKQIKRTEGVSTTDIVGRMLLMTREHHVPTVSPTEAPGDAGNGVVTSGVLRTRSASLGGQAAEEAAAAAVIPQSHSKFLPTARRIMQFADGRVPKPDDRVVYIGGAFDLFNAGHIAALQEARKLGDFLLVGVHDDPTVNSMRGHGLPILNLYERTLSLLACKYVDEVIIGAPFEITQEMITTMNISVVAKGAVSDMENRAAHEELDLDYNEAKVRELVEAAYEVPRKAGILREFTSPNSLTALDIIDRIMKQREQFQKRYTKKSASEAAYVAQKTYVQEA